MTAIIEIVYSVNVDRPGIPIRWSGPPPRYFSAERLPDGSIKVRPTDERRLIGITDDSGRLHLKGVESAGNFHVHQGSDGTFRLVPRRGVVMSPDVTLIRYQDGGRIRTERVKGGFNA